MIGTIDICIQAAKPNFPLDPVFSFVGSPSSFRIRNVPKKVGRWAIIKVYVSCEYPDGETNTAECVLTSGVWVGTVKDGATVSGKVDNGFTVVADGLDENGDLVQGYVLGMGDLAILANDSSIHPYLTGHRLTLFDTIPENPKKGDSYLDDGWLRIYDGTQWTDKPEIEVPTKVSELENDVPYAEQGDLDTTSQAAYEALSQSTNNATAIEQLDGRMQEVEGDIDNLDDLIPSQASIDNQLADKDFVNSSIATNTAYFKGTFNSVDELPTDDVTNNDYAFVVGQDSEGNITYNRYKFNGSSWVFEYTLNNSSFTADQWATINSGVTQQQIENLQIIAGDGYSLARQADEAATQANADVAGINDKIPGEASSQNQLADKAYVAQKALEVSDSEIQGQPTSTLSGEYEDGTEFSFDFVIKN